MAMKGKDLVEMLMKELNQPNRAQLAKKLAVKPGQIQAWEKANLTKVIVRNVIRKVRNSAINQSIRPIVEFHELNHPHGDAKDTLLKKINNPKVCKELKATKGIYAFYDSNGSIIYVGKTERGNLLAEMTQAFELVRQNYKRKLANGNGKFSIHTLAIRHTADFVSAYEVDENLIGNVEAFLTRLIPNDVVNKKTENFKQ